MSRRLREFARRAAGARQHAASRPTTRRVSIEPLETRALMTTSDPLAGFLTGPSALAPVDVVTGYLAQHGDAFGFGPGDASRAIVTNQYADEPSGTTHLYLEQGFNGVGVENARISAAVSRSGQLLFVGGNFVPGLGATPSLNAPPLPNLTAAQAITAAAAQLGLTATGPLVSVVDPAGPDQSGTYSYPGVASEDIPVHLDYTAMPGGVRESWAIHINTPYEPEFHGYDIRVDGETGQILDLADWVDNIDNSRFNVYALPGVSPLTSNRSIVIDPADPLASPYGWFDTNGQPGAESTLTTGNNVNAYLDLQGTGSGKGPQPNGGNALNFNFPIDLSQDPDTYTDASTTQLFYLNNEAHDIHYHYGFTEAAGNFQVNNYGKGGIGGDAVRAANEFGRALGNANNSFMFTPPDGQAPLEQMYIFDQNPFTGAAITPARNASVDADVVIHENAHGLSNRLTGGAANANALNALQSGGMGEGWSDWYALMFTQTPAQNLSSVRPVGNYVLNENFDGPGIRRYPYSYDMSKDPLTIGFFNGDGESHDTGEIWASTLWDMNLLLTAKYGFDANLETGYTGTGPGGAGNKLALQLVADGLKLQPANPSFSDARNAILTADRFLTGGRNQYEIWSAFARRGMGFSFDDGGSSASPTVVEAFDLPRVVFVEPVQTLNANELESIDGTKLAEFFDGSPGTFVASDYSVSIDWGDGTAPTPGQVVPLSKGFEVRAVGKTYDEGGTYTITISVTNNVTQVTGQGTLAAVIADAPLLASQPVALSGVEGASTAFTLGTFTDTDPHATPPDPSSYKVTVVWGDGTTGAGSVAAIDLATRQYQVTAANAYPRFGTYTYTATVTAKGGATAVYSGKATIDDAPLLPGAAPTDFLPVEGVFFSGTVASVIDANPFGLLADLSAKINWGDNPANTFFPALVVRDPKVASGFLVMASHRYARFGSYEYTVEIDSVGGSSLPITGTVVVADANFSLQGTSFGLVEGQTFDGVSGGVPVPGLIATLRDDNASGLASDYSVQINWGDGTAPVAGVIASAGGGNFLVKGAHRYNKEGKFTITAAVTSAAGLTQTVTSTATVANASLTGSTTGIGPLTATEGKAFSGAVANFVDGNPTELLTDFAVTINWGDGTDATTGTVSQPTAGGPYVISGSHVYSRFGTFTISTAINDDAGGSTSATLPITVADAAIQAAGFEFLQGSEGVAFTQPVATFLDANPLGLITDFTAQISWGDGTTSAGTITQPDPAVSDFEVAGNHVYQTQLTPYLATITITSLGGVTQTVTSTISIPNGVLAATPVALSPAPAEGVQFNSLVTTFTDTNPNPKPGEYSATIFWGDGTSSAGVILPSNGRFDVRGSHLYFAGEYQVTVSIRDAAGGTAEAFGTVTVGAAAITANGFPALKTVEGATFADPVAGFLSANPLAIAADFTATINWGDDSPQEAGIITPAGLGGAFTVSGSHVFQYGAGQPITVTIQSIGGQSAQVVSTIDVADASLQAFAIRDSAGVGQNAFFRLASLIDGAGVASLPSDLAVTIAWGDGTASVGQIDRLSELELPGNYVVFGSHVYAAAGTYRPQVTILDAGGARADVTTELTVVPASIAVDISFFGTQEKSPYTGDVATFSTVNLLAQPGDFTTTIAWGDGVSTPGQVVPLGGGRFTVVGSHTYANSGLVNVTVVVKSIDGVTAVGSGAVNIFQRFVPITGSLTGGGTGPATNNPRPSFAGTAEAGDVVTLTAIRAGLAEPILVGQVPVAADGTWSVTSSFLIDGSYTVTASAADGNGVLSAEPLAFPSFVVDTVAPRITSVQLVPQVGKVFVTFQDDRSGLVDAALANPTNYSLFGAGAARIPLRSIAVTPGSGSADRIVILDFGKPAKGRGRAIRYIFSIAGANFADEAGNALSEQFYLPPQTATKSGYLAQLVVNGNVISGPIAVQGRRQAARQQAARLRAARLLARR